MIHIANTGYKEKIFPNVRIRVNIYIRNVLSQSLFFYNWQSAYMHVYHYHVTIHRNWLNKWDGKGPLTISFLFVSWLPLSLQSIQMFIFELLYSILNNFSWLHFVIVQNWACTCVFVCVLFHVFLWCGVSVLHLAIDKYLISESTRYHSIQ